MDYSAGGWPYPHGQATSSSVLGPPGVDSAVVAAPSVYAPSLAPPPSSLGDGYRGLPYPSYPYLPTSEPATADPFFYLSGGTVGGSAITRYQNKLKEITTLNALQSNATWKKRLKKTVKLVQSVHCEVCKIVCNSQEVLNNHKLGRKHKRNLEKLKESLVSKPPRAENRNKHVKRKDDMATVDSGTKKQMALEGGGEATRKSMLPTTEITTAIQPVPQTAGTQPVLQTSTSTGAIGSLLQNAEGNKISSVKRSSSPAKKNDLETKKRKVLECGAAAEAVKVCTICNVVCNGDVVFGNHLVGKKHLAMVKKQQESSGN